MTRASRSGACVARVVPYVLVALLLPLLAALSTSAASATPLVTASVVTPVRAASGSVVATPPGPRSGVVRALRRALRAADDGARVPRRTDPSDVDLASDVRTLPPACTADPGEDRHEICVRGDTDAARTVVVIGNSHMAMWLAGLEGEAERRGVRLVSFIKYGCAPYTFQMYREGVAWTECSSWRDWAIEQTRAIAPDLAVVAGHTWLRLLDRHGEAVRSGPDWDRQWRDGVQGLAAALADDAGRVVVLGDTTTRRSQPGRCARRRGATLASCEHRITDSTRSVLRLTEIGAQAGGAEYLDMNAFACLRDRCPLVAGRTYVFRDRLGHLTASWSQRVARAFASSLRLAS